MSQTKLRIIHETNPRKYYPALFELAETGQVDLVGTHRYSVVKEWVRAWLRDRTPLIERSQNALNDLIFRLRIPFVKDETIVIGFAPWDWRLLIYRSLAKRNRIMYQTSWHDWRLDNTPRQPKPNWFKLYMQNQWHAFVTHPNVKVIAVTPEVARTVERETGVKASVIPHAVPDVFFEAGRNRFPRETSPLKLLYVGEISEKKGIKVLLKLMEQLKEQEISLTIVGNGPLVNLVENHSSEVTYLGPIFDREKLAQIMAEHDVLMLLSQKTKTWEELFGIVIIEAIAAGCAVIATQHIGPREILSNSNGAGLFNESDSKGICSALRTIQINRIKLKELRDLQRVASRYSVSTLKTDWQNAMGQP
jgi:glycosyltransferase involved in cell wall biosynthesis